MRPWPHGDDVLVPGTFTGGGSKRANQHTRLGQAAGYFTRRLIVLMTIEFSTRNQRIPPLELGGRAMERAYNPCMLHTFQTLVGTAVMERATLLINHVLASEPVAAQRLLPHAGRCIQVHLKSWPQPLPPLPILAFRITPAGLVEWCGADPPMEADLSVSVDASNPAMALAKALAGERAPVDVTGDAGFATDVNWLFDNLRWDVQDDLARIVGPVPARELARLAGSIAAGMREAVRTLSGLAARRRGGPAEQRPR